MHVQLAEAPGTGMSPTERSAEHTFLTTRDVFARYGWKRTYGYRMTRSPGFPGRIGNRYRLDLLLAWEEQQLTNARRQADGGQPAQAVTVDSPGDALSKLPRRGRTRGLRQKGAM
jgi:hypothetical protein